MFFSPTAVHGPTFGIICWLHFEMASVEKSAPKWTFMRALSLDDDDEAHQDLYSAMKVCVVEPADQSKKSVRF